MGCVTNGLIVACLHMWWIVLVISYVASVFLCLPIRFHSLSLCLYAQIVAICQYVDILQCQRYRCCPFLTTWMKLILPRLESIIGQKRYFSSCLAKPGTGLIASKYWLVFKLIANWPGSAVKLQPCFIAGIVAISHSLSNLQQWHRGQTTFCQ